MGGRGLLLKETSLNAQEKLLDYLCSKGKFSKV